MSRIRGVKYSYQFEQIRFIQMIYWRLADRFLYLVKLIELIFNLEHVSTQYKTICTISKKAEISKGN